MHADGGLGGRRDGLIFIEDWIVGWGCWIKCLMVLSLCLGIIESVQGDKVRWDRWICFGSS